MKFEILNAKNGEKTIKADSLFLHSSYDPSKEAERFVSTLNIQFYPKRIVVIEPALGYCLNFLRKKYSECKIGFIKFSKEIPTPSDFDFEIDYLNHKNNFETYLSSLFNESEIFETLFVSWPPSSKIFAQEDSFVWNTIKNLTEKSKTLLITREYFEKKWLINSALLIKSIKKTVSLKNNINLPVLICASGPSLKKNLKAIKNNQNKFFIIALSSALSVLLKNNIIPDLVFTTDGGFWAGEHLKKCKNLNIAIPLEAYCQKHILSENNILPLIYEEGISSNLLKYSELSFTKVKRNGTVSGSAVDFALNSSDSKIYFLGLDLSSQIGFQHTQPNELEINNSIKDNRIKTKEKRIFPGSFRNSSLEIYESWFKNQNFPNNRIYRIIDKEYKKNDLGKIQDLLSTDFESLCKNYPEIQRKDFFTEVQIRNINNDCTKVYNYLSSELQKEEMLKELFPLSYVLLSHLDKNSQNYDLQKSKIDKELNKLLKKLEKSLYVR